MKKRVTVIIPNWNGVHLLPDCLYSLQEQLYKHHEVIIVDNGSTDGSVEFVKRQFPVVKIIELNENTGFAHAVNVGIAATETEFVALLNNDTKVTEHWLKHLIRQMETSHKIAACTSKMLNFFDTDLIDGCGDRINIVGQGHARGEGQRDLGQFETTEEVFSACGGASLYRRAIFDKIGVFDEDFFAYFEDLDWAFRAQLAGYKIFYVHDAVVYHRHGATANKRKKFRHYLEFRNTWQLIIKNFPLCLFLRRGRWWKLPFVHIRTFRYFMKKGMSAEAVRVEWYLLTQLFHLLKKRRQIQKFRKVTCRMLDKKIDEKKLKIGKWSL